MPNKTGAASVLRLRRATNIKAIVGLLRRHSPRAVQFPTSSYNRCVEPRGHPGVHCLGLERDDGRRWNPSDYDQSIKSIKEGSPTLSLRPHTDSVITCHSTLQSDPSMYPTSHCPAKYTVSQKHSTFYIHLYKTSTKMLTDFQTSFTVVLSCLFPSSLLKVGEGCRIPHEIPFVSTPFSTKQAFTRL